MKNKRFTRGYVRALGETDGLLVGVVGSTDAVDRYGEVIDQESWDLTHYRKNPVILWAHNLTSGEDRPPIGRAVDVKIENNQLVFSIQFDMADPFAADIFRKYKEKFLNAFSVGFMPHKIERSSDNNEPPVLKDNELFELSCVPVPANPEALNSLRARSFRVKTWDKLMKEVEAEEEKGDEDQGDETETVDKTADAVIEKIMPSLTKTITDVVTDAIKKSTPEDKGGAADSASTKTSQGQEKLVALIRETTKTFQSTLAEFNAKAKNL